MKAVTVQEIMDNNGNEVVRVSQAGACSYDSYDNVLWEGLLFDIPDQYRQREVKNIGYLMGAKIFRIEVI